MVNGVDLYLDLLVEFLIGRLLEDPPIDPGSGPDYEPAKREQGLDWPRSALSMIGALRMKNLRALCEAAIVDGVEGDFAEAGVWRGGACILMRGLLKAHGIANRRVWVCDSFEGLPKPDPKVAADAGDTFYTYTDLAISEEVVKRNFERLGLLDGQVKFVKGWFETSLSASPIERLAVLRADGDMYSSTAAILRALAPKVSPGGYVIIDDYGAIPACKAATDDYRHEQGITSPLTQIDWTGVYWRVPR